MDTTNNITTTTATGKNTKTTRASTPKGEFVWVRQGKTRYQAQLIIPRRDDAAFQSENGEVSIRWQDAGYRDVVNVRDIVEIDDGASGGRRRAKASHKIAGKFSLTQLLSDITRHQLFLTFRFLFRSCLLHSGTHLFSQ